jgi:hypothetical protein
MAYRSGNASTADPASPGMLSRNISAKRPPPAVTSARNSAPSIAAAASAARRCRFTSAPCSALAWSGRTTSPARGGRGCGSAFVWDAINGSKRMARDLRKPRKGEPTPLHGEWRWATYGKKRQIFHFLERTGAHGGKEIWAFGFDGLWHWIGQLKSIGEPITE